jgi:HEAT repeat protein
MIVFSCPNCDVEIEAPDNKAGAKATCAECGVRLEIPNGAKKTPPAAVKKPAPAKRRRDDDLDESVIEKPRPAPKRRRDEDEDEIVSTPRAAAKRRRDEDEDEEDGSSTKKKSQATLLWIGGGGAAIVAAVVLVLVVNASKKNESLPDNPQAKKPPSAPIQNPPVVTKVGDTKEVVGVKNEDEDVKEDLLVESKAKPNAKDIFRHVLKSSTWIINAERDGSMSMGSGTLIDKKSRLVLTNYHVVMNHADLVAFFPVFASDGKLVRERNSYLDKVIKKDVDIIHAHVVRSDRGRDLSIIQLDRLPDGVDPLPVAQESVSDGDEVYSIGNPGAQYTGALWVLATGKVRAMYRKKFQPGGYPSIIDCKVLETDSPTNPGDSGGPMVNGNGELVGVTEGVASLARGISIFVELQEAKDFIEETCRKAKITWAREDAKALQIRSAGQVIDYVKYLRNKNPKVRAKAAQRLAAFGPAAKAAIPELIHLLKDPEQLNRALAQEALSKIGAPDSKQIPLLTKCLKDPVREVRAYSAGALGKLERSAHSAAGALVTTLKDADPTVRRQAAWALGKVGYDKKKEAFADLQPLLHDSDHDVRVAAAEALTTVCPLDTSDLPFLQELLKHEDVDARTVAARALVRLGAQAKAALPAVIAAVKENYDRNFRRAALRMIGQFGPDAKDAVPVLLDVMKDEDLRPNAAAVFIKMGRAARDAVKTLTEGLEDPNPDTQANCIIALGKIGPDAEEAVPKLAELLKERKLQLRLIVLDALLGIGAKAHEAHENLVPLFEEKDKALRQKVTDVLVKIGKPALDALCTALLTDKNVDVREGAADALGAIGPRARTAQVIRALQGAMMTDPQKRVKQAAQKAWYKITAKKRGKYR